MSKYWYTRVFKIELFMDLFVFSGCIFLYDLYVLFEFYKRKYYNIIQYLL